MIFYGNHLEKYFGFLKVNLSRTLLYLSYNIALYLQNIILQILSRSLVGSIGHFLVSRWTDGCVIIGDRHESLPSDHIDDSFVFPHEILHLLLDVGIMLHQVLKMLLTEEQVLFQFYVMSGVVSVDFVYLRTLRLDNSQFFGAITDYFFDLFCR